jgi:hypothetical protein
MKIFSKKIKLKTKILKIEIPYILYERSRSTSNRLDESNRSRSFEETPYPCSPRLVSLFSN